MDTILNSIICYNNAKEIIEYVSKLSELDHSDLLAVSIVINDDKTDKTELENSLKRLPIKSVVTKPESNLGYMNGLVEGVKQYLLKYQDSIKWIIMSNTDISYPDKEFINKFVSKNYSDDIWCIGPSVFVPSKNAYDNPVALERRSIKAVNKIIFIFSIPFIRIVYQVLSNLKTKLCKKNESSSSIVYEVHGCYFIVNIELYKKMLENPYKAFMYSEEAYVSEMIYQNGKKNYFDSDLRIEHNEHSVTSTLKYRKIAKLIADSMKYIKSEFYQQEK